MMLLKMELRKIWKPKILIIIFLMGFLFYFLYLRLPLGDLEGFPRQQYNLMLEWTKKYGTQMDREEYGNVLCGLRTSLGVTDEKADINTLYGYSNYNATVNTLMCYKESYEKYTGDLDEELFTSEQIKRIRDIIQNNKLGFLPDYIKENDTRYWGFVSVFVLLSVIILIAPAAAADKMSDMRPLQFSAKCGRKIMNTQLLAALLSAVLMVVLEIAVFGAMYAGMGRWNFWNNPISSLFGYEASFYWFDLNFGQYFMFILLLIVLLALGAVGIVFSLSCFSRNYIALMLRIILVFILFVILSNSCINNLLGLNNALYKLTNIKGIQIYAGVSVFLAGAGTSLLTLRFFRRQGERQAD